MLVEAGVGSVDDDDITDLREYCGLWRRGRGLVALVQPTSLADTTFTSAGEEIAELDLTATLDQDRRVRQLCHIALADDTDSATVVAEIRIDGDGRVRARQGISAANNSGSMSPRFTHTGDGESHDFTVFVDTTSGGGNGTIITGSDAATVHELEDVGGLDMPADSEGQP